MAAVAPHMYRLPWFFLWKLSLVAALSSATLAGRASDGFEIELLPAEVELVGPTAHHLLVVERREGGRYAGTVSGTVALSSSDPSVARVDGSTVHAVGDGSAVITASVDGHVAEAHVTVRGTKQAHAWSFRNHVQSVFSKVGCNSGACHGALAGKGGMKLSLRGYDTERDYMTITRQARGRRVELADPARSLILAKPTGAVPHKGGVRFQVGSPEYRIISEWIAGGATPPQPDDPRIQKLEIIPDRAVLEPDAEQQLIVRAHFDDETVEDVTRWCKFSSANASVAQVDDQGHVSIVGHGEGAVTAWYLSKLAIARVVSPFDNPSIEQAIESAPRHNFVDRLVLEKLADLNIPPSPPATDATFLRRAYLDTIGRLPRADEARRFLRDDSVDKRQRLVDALLARPEFVDYWTYKWSDVLLLTSQRLRPAPLKAYYEWIRSSVSENKPWDQLVWEILTARGSSVQNGATNFFSLHQDPQEMAENASVAFLGLNINCARCHNHPLEKWTNDQYYAMANLFSRVRAKGWGGDFRSGDGVRTVYTASQGELIQPLHGKPQPPTPLDGQPLDFQSSIDRRVYLAQWMTSPDNENFRRAITNRVWANFFGRGLVEMVDDLRISNPASNERLLAEAADYLAAHDFDLKSLMRLLLSSATYQRSSRVVAENSEDDRFYSRYFPRRLMAEVLLDAISDVTGVATSFTSIELGAGERQKTDAYPLGTRAIQLRDAAVSSYFLKTFGRNERLITCECQRSNTPSMIQVLHIANGDTINEKLRDPDSRVARMVAQEVPFEQIINDAYVSALSRYPTPRETSQLLAQISQADEQERQILIEDLYWSILSSREFLFNH